MKSPVPAKASQNTSATYTGRNLHGQVVKALGHGVLGGTYPAGELLPNEEELCRTLDVSRTALREAIKVLAAKGLLESRPRVGTWVRPESSWNMLDPDVLSWRCATGPDAQFLRHLTEMREIIEPAAAALAARSRSPAQLADLEAAFAAMENAADVNQWVEADLAFHSAVLQATNNPLLVPLAAIIGSALESLLGISARKAGGFNDALPDHRKVLDAIRMGDAQRALHRMAVMLSDTRELMQRSDMLADARAEAVAPEV
ncbi:DNA-binding FadR family transcriptional regulator [Rhodoferax ferrireducens]|uniref:DNA-binding FadR family transcriptional regulator n=1 Tax=Rhodoferax ferrireducens TaxID=192843 RepID=A0ABU2C1Z9_9BURK|nr:FadR/GntR family transcriptional regulator [Rhodoferax ferrireducens]MDR7375366.1 DNA-binding FadR family transcriptional regulator [Rhodoferax ferrireducens]